MPFVNAEPLEIVPNKVRRKGEHEPVPVMDLPILLIGLVQIAVHWPRLVVLLGGPRGWGSHSLAT